MVSIDGVVKDDPRISVFDRGFLFGDSVYEVLRTVNGRPLFWGEHADRLWRSAELVKLPLGVDRDTLRAETERTLAAAEGGEHYIRIVVTRGAGGLGLELGEMTPCRVIIVAPLPTGNEALRARGCVLRTVRTGRSDEGGVSPQAKSGNKLAAVLALDEVRRQGADEALLVDPLGRVLEGASSTFFCVVDGAVLTPSLDVGILPGITRAKVIELATRLGLTVREAAVHTSDLDAAEEAFITSSVRGLLPIRGLDDRTLEVTGPVTERLRTAYEAFLR